MLPSSSGLSSRDAEFGWLLILTSGGTERLSEPFRFSGGGVSPNSSGEPESERELGSLPLTRRRFEQRLLSMSNITLANLSRALC